MKEELKIQNFKSEAEEARFWDDNPDALAHAFEEAAAAGTLGRGTAARKGNTPTTTIRLDREDIGRARMQAELRGLKYQTYLKMLIHNALRQTELELVGVDQGKGSRSK
jgi:predicted DNA binding CopG/RHH family protein